MGTGHTILTCLSPATYPGVRLGRRGEWQMTFRPPAGADSRRGRRETLVVPVLIRPARREDFVAIRQIEREAGQRYRDFGLAEVAEDEPPSIEVLEGYLAATRIWVAERDGYQPVGYVVVEEIDGAAHIEQVSVLSDYQGHGIGRALIERVHTWAIESGMAALTLTSFGHIPWNRPLYEHLGFRVISEQEAGPGLLALRDGETQRGLDPKLRVMMRLDLLA